ncbi:MAG: hypothetical protein GWN92_07680, partial [candidate division Zixibacteria bacterium]|nr:hypothetical protein [candidate division Zixibacteria bacterium]
MEDEEIQVPDHLKEEIHERVIELIKKIMSRCFAPIFIFTREEDDVITSEIKNRLRKHDLYSEDGSCAIFVMNKGELRDADVLMAIIETWIVENPSIYLIKHWQHHVISAHGFLFWSLYKIHPGWPGILWKASVDEKSDPDSDINEILFRLVMNSSEDIKFDKKIITKNKKYDTKDVIGIIRATMYRSEPNEGFKPGDIFKMNRRYYLNIRPECDTVPGRDRSDLLYCVKGRRVSPKVLGERYDEKKGFDRHIDDVILPFVDGERCVQFNFKSFEIYPKEEIAEKRICRLLPPYITHIQQNFASFIGRIGTPR